MWEYCVLKLRSLQFIRIVLSMSECLHREGIQYGGRYDTLFKAPRQSEMISTLPFNSGCILFTLSNSRCIAISPRSSPRYAFATAEPSENDPVIRPRPFLHSKTNAAEHRWGYNSLMYEPSVTATSVPLLIERCIQSVPPDTFMLSHSHVLPHSL